jgi:hypothetical protein
MAKVVFGGLVSEVRGTLGADVYTRNRAGGIVRTQTTLPWTPTTLRGQAVDNLITVLTLWSLTLTQPQRDAWNAFAAVQSRAHTAIAQTQLSGQAWFIKLNVPLIPWEAGPLYEPPGDISVTQLEQFSISQIAVAATQFTVNWQPGIPTNHGLAVKATDSISLGISSWLHQQGLAELSGGEAQTTLNIWDDYVAYHPTPVAALKIGATARFLNLANGVYSQPLRAEAVVEA